MYRYLVEVPAPECTTRSVEVYADSRAEAVAAVERQTGLVHLSVAMYG